MCIGRGWSHTAHPIAFVVAIGSPRQSRPNGDATKSQSAPAEKSNYIANISLPIAPFGMILWLPCEEQKKQNPAA
jgi:hypothetical protein